MKKLETCILFRSNTGENCAYVMVLFSVVTMLSDFQAKKKKKKNILLKILVQKSVWVLKNWG